MAEAILWIALVLLVLRYWMHVLGAAMWGYILVREWIVHELMR